MAGKPSIPPRALWNPCLDPEFGFNGGLRSRALGRYRFDVPRICSDIQYSLKSDSNCADVGSAKAFISKRYLGR